MTRTRIKICGITRPEDALAAAELGADAIGFVFWKPSARAVTPARAGELSRVVPPFVARVALFVDPPEADVAAVIAACHPDLLQFHGDESSFETLEANERKHILAALAQTRWVIDGPRGAARILALHPNTLRSRMKKLGIRRSHDATS